MDYTEETLPALKCRTHAVGWRTKDEENAAAVPAGVYREIPVTSLPMTFRSAIEHTQRVRGLTSEPDFAAIMSRVSDGGYTYGVALIGWKANAHQS